MEKNEILLFLSFHTCTFITVLRQNTISRSSVQRESCQRTSPLSLFLHPLFLFCAGCRRRRRQTFPQLSQGAQERRIFSFPFWLRSADPPFLLTHLPLTSIHVVPWLAGMCVRAAAADCYPCSIASFLPRPPPVLHLASAACLVVVLRSSVPPRIRVHCANDRKRGCQMGGSRKRIFPFSTYLAVQKSKGFF